MNSEILNTNSVEIINNLIGSSPETVDQILSFYLWTNSVWVVISVILGFISFKVLRKYDLDTILGLVKGWLSVIGIIIFPFIFLTNLQMLVLNIFAPNVFIVEYVSGLMRSY